LSHKPFRDIKPEIRILGIDDGKFTPHTKGSVLIVGVVLRGGGSLDGVMHTYIAIDGMEATEKIAEMVNASPHHRQLRLIMLNGVTFGGFNIADIKKLSTLTKLPVMALTHDRPDLQSIHEALENLAQTEERWRMILEAGEIHEIPCKGSKLYMGLAGIDLTDALRIVELTSTRGCFPEPLRVAHLIASGISP
jgi:endonuclease V-like protein UPF0215 family